MRAELAELVSEHGPGPVAGPRGGVPIVLVSHLPEEHHDTPVADAARLASSIGKFMPDTDPDSFSPSLLPYIRNAVGKLAPGTDPGTIPPWILPYVREGSKVTRLIDSKHLRLLDSSKSRIRKKWAKNTLRAMRASRDESGWSGNG
ncbi:MAG: hypothetical protein O7B99_05435 [Planctomycetota bacterium]|nr:hypothetical protein [Planctomycetota bacterium]